MKGLGRRMAGQQAASDVDQVEKYSIMDADVEDDFVFISGMCKTIGKAHLYHYLLLFGIISLVSYPLYDSVLLLCIDAI